MERIEIPDLYIKIYNRIEDAVSEDHTMLMKAHHRMLCTNEQWYDYNGAKKTLLENTSCWHY